MPQMNQFSSSDLSDYQENGFLIARSLFSNEEIELLGQTARADNAMDKSSTSRDDGDGNAVRLAFGIIQETEFMECLPDPRDLLTGLNNCSTTKLIITTPKWC